jgi:tight adherence protein C
MTSTRIEDFRLEDWLPYWLTPEQLIAGLAALAVLVAFLAVWNALRGRDSFARRYLLIAQRRESLRQTALDTKRGRQRLTAAGMMSHIVTRLNLLRSKHAQEARQLLAQAGMRSSEAMIRYLFARLSMPFVFGAVVLADSYGAHVLPVPDRLRTFAALGAALLGFFAPDVFMKNLIKKRQHQMELGLPDALDLLVICAEAGLSLDTALVRVSRELEVTWRDLSEEFGITAAELTYLPERKLAFENLNSRTNMASVRGVVNTLLQTAKFGTPLAHSLRILAAEFREARITRAEEKAARLPAMLTVPMILFILPTLFIVLLGPAALSIIDTFSGKAQAHSNTVTTSTGGGGGDGDRSIVVNERPAGVTEAGGEARIVRRGVPVATAPRERLPSEAHITPLSPTVASGQLVTVDIDARALRPGSQQRVILVPANAPLVPADAAAFLHHSMPVAPDLVRLSLRAEAAGPAELRLYYVPSGGASPVVAARAPLTVTAAN